MNTSLKELARSKIDELFKTWTDPHTHGSDFTEQDTIFHFILPFLEALGWNIHDVNEVKLGRYPRLFQKALPVERRAIDKPDCVISFHVLT